MRTIDKLEKIGAEKVKTILVEDFGALINCGCAGGKSARFFLMWPCL